MKYLVFDISNLLYRTFFVNKGEQDVTVAGLAHHSALLTLNKYFNQFKPDKVVMLFDRPSWRKEYTASDACVSKRPYKGNRRQTMTPAEKAKYQLFMTHLGEFEQMIRDHTTIIALAADRLEADDLAAGFVQMYSEDNEIVIISSDKDLIQLLGYPNVRLIDPSSGKDRTLEEWGNDSEYFLFEKCIRGDKGDNVISALPRVKSTRIKEAYGDTYKRTKLMEETWTGIDGTVFTVKNLYRENSMLMDLREQPEDITKSIIKTILEGMNKQSKFSYFHFMKFLGKYQLKKLAEQADQFNKLFSR